VLDYLPRSLQEIEASATEPSKKLIDIGGSSDRPGGSPSAGSAFGDLFRTARTTLLFRCIHVILWHGGTVSDLIVCAPPSDHDVDPTVIGVRCTDIHDPLMLSLMRLAGLPGPRPRIPIPHPRHCQWPLLSL